MIICSCNVLSDQDVRKAMTTSVLLRTIGEFFPYSGPTAQWGVAPDQSSWLWTSKRPPEPVRDHGT
jgi:hypothetical protein